MNIKISIVNYDCGNLKSISSALREIGAKNINLVNSEKEIMTSDCLILPGVGAFGHAMQKLKNNNLVNPIKRYVEKGGKIMGICLGMQMLFDTSEEMGFHKGFGFIKGKIKILENNKIPNNYKVPNVGWRAIFRNKNSKNWNGTILSDNKNNDFMYFVHSYVAYPICENNILAFSDHNGLFFPAVVASENVFGCQFHPEKSGLVGLKILRQFLKIVMSTK